MKKNTVIQILLVIMIVSVLVIGINIKPVEASNHTCWTTAYGYGVNTSVKVLWQHSNILRVNIPSKDFWRVRYIYYQGQYVGPYNVNKVSGDKLSHDGDPYTDLYVSSKFAGIKWNLRNPSASNWSVDYLCY